ncbi:hypothetical protein [Actinophytocola sp.]|uniref:hypothetical protein n=1 Tax=Actinophytocola sp. TaxID=1872138 RepID=UPI003D6C5320
MFNGWRERRAIAKLQKVAAGREAGRIAARTPTDLLDPLVRELVEIGYETDYRDSERVREIGKLLHARGGLPEMQDAYYELINWHNINARGLSSAWDRVGDWQA